MDLFCLHWVHLEDVDAVEKSALLFRQKHATPCATLDLPPGAREQSRPFWSSFTSLYSITKSPSVCLYYNIYLYLILYNCVLRRLTNFPSSRLPNLPDSAASTVNDTDHGRRGRGPLVRDAVLRRGGRDRRCDGGTSGIPHSRAREAKHRWTTHVGPHRRRRR